MPWERTWVQNPSDNEIEVHQFLPEGFEEYPTCGQFKHSRLPTEVLIEAQKSGKALDHRSFYECTYCNGWIEGRPYEYYESDLGPLCGRRGTVSSCRRCGREIGFSGMVS